MELEIQTEKVKRLAENLDAIERKLNKIGSEAEEIGNNVKISSTSARTIQKNLQFISSEINRSAESVGKLSSGLSQSVSWYAQSEKEISGAGEAVIPITSEQASTGTSGETSDTKGGILSWSDFWKFVSEAGIIGSGLAAIFNMVTGDGSAKNWINSGKYMLKMIGNGLSAVGKAKWKDYLLGLKDSFEKMDMSSVSSAWRSYWAKTADDLTFETGGITVKNAKVATKWGGYILTSFANGFENYEEYQNSGGQMTAGRAVAETVIETGVDIGLGVVGGAAVAAGAAALGVTAAPAVVTGLAVAGVTWAANGICEWITGGDDIGETVANGVCDGFSAAKNWLGNVVNGVSSLWSKGMLLFG